MRQSTFSSAYQLFMHVLVCRHRRYLVYFVSSSLLLGSCMMHQFPYLQAQIDRWVEARKPVMIVLSRINDYFDLVNWCELIFHLNRCKLLDTFWMLLLQKLLPSKNELIMVRTCGIYSLLYPRDGKISKLCLIHRAIDECHLLFRGKWKVMRW